MEKTKKKTKDNGITLIALVITIIVLLILAGISISMLLGDNGILQQGINAKTKTESKSELEQVQLSVNDTRIKAVSNGNSKINGEELEKSLKKYFGLEVKLTGNGPWEYYGKSGVYEIEEDGTINQKEGIVISESLIQLEPGESEVLKAILKNIKGTITWSSSDEDIATVDKDGKVTAKSNGNAVITATCSTGNTDTCNVNVKQLYIDSSYVEYPVEYTDVQTGTTYTKNIAWRMITKDEDLEISTEGTKETINNANIKIISTGIPVKLHNRSSNIVTITEEEGYKKWLGSNTDVENYIKPKTEGGAGLYSSSNNENYNMKIVAGLYYNFQKIVFNVQSGETLANSLSDKTIGIGYGGFISIKNFGNVIVANNSITGASLFNVSNLNSGRVTNIRSVTSEDIKDVSSDIVPKITDATDKRPGLFKLSSYTLDEHNMGTKITDDAMPSTYLLASPVSSDNYKIRIVLASQEDNGYSTNRGAHGLRPVITLSGVTLSREKDSHVWKIVNNSNNRTKLNLKKMIKYITLQKFVN